MNPPSWWRQKMTSWWWCHDNDVMIAATLHWLLCAMWHANHLINIHVSSNRKIVESGFAEKKHETHFYEWNGAFRKFGQIGVISFRYPRWNPCMPSLLHVSPFGKYRHQLSTITSPWFQYLSRALKNILSRRFSSFWARVGRVTGTKQLFCHSLISLILSIWSMSHIYHSITSK